jgi:hypothetical protein
MPVISPITTTPPTAEKDKGMPRNDFANFFGTNKQPNQGTTNPSPTNTTNNVNPVKPPEPPKPPVPPAEKP